MFGVITVKTDTDIWLEWSSVWQNQGSCSFVLLSIQYILTVRHILVECNHLAQARNYIFGRCGVVESLQFHPELVLIFF